MSEVGLLNAADADAARYAVDNGMIVITKDEDFVRLHTAGGGNPKVMWIRFGNTSNRELELSLRPKLDEVLTAFEQGEVLVEIR